jgi:MFS family permease
MSMNKKTYCITIVILLLFIALLNYLDRSTLSIANTEIAAAFNIPPAEMGFLLSAFMWPYALASLPAGYIIDRFGINKIMIGSMLAWSMACVLGGLVIGFYSILFTRLLLGVAEAPFFIIATKIIQLNFRADKRGLVSSIVSLGPRLANVLAPVLLVGLMLLIDWRGMFILLGVIGVALTVVWHYIHKGSADPQVTEQNSDKPNISLVKIFANRNIQLLCIGNLGSSYAYWLFLTWLPYYFIKIRHLSLSEMGVATSASFVMAVLAVMLGGMISDYLIKLNVTATIARLIPIIFGCLVAGIAMVTIPFIENIYAIVGVISLTIFCLGLRVAPTWALVADMSPPTMVGTIGGIQNFANFIGAGLAPLATGLILSMTNDNFNIVFVVGSIICLCGSISYLFIHEINNPKDI